MDSTHHTARTRERRHRRGGHGGGMQTIESSLVQAATRARCTKEHGVLDFRRLYSTVDQCGAPAHRRPARGQAMRAHASTRYSATMPQAKCAAQVSFATSSLPPSRHRRRRDTRVRHAHLVAFQARVALIVPGNLRGANCSSVCAIPVCIHHP